MVDLLKLKGLLTSLIEVCDYLKVDVQKYSLLYTNVHVHVFSVLPFVRSSHYIYMIVLLLTNTIHKIMSFK